MEGMGLFNIAGTGGDGNMRTAVHTRRIIDPIFGSKITGTIGKTTFGVLNAADDKPDIADHDAGAGRYATRSTRSAAPRTRCGGRIISAASSPTPITTAATTSWPAATCRSGCRRHRLSRRRFSPRRPASAPVRQRPAMRCRRATDTRRAAINVARQIEHYDRDFQMDTAFYNRTGFTAGWSFGEINFYPRSGTDFWIQRIHPFYFTKIGHDDIQDGGEDFVNYGIRFNLTRQGFLNVSTEPRPRTVAGHEVRRRSGHQRLRQRCRCSTGWSSMAGAGSARRSYYDPVDPFQGRSWFADIGVTFQPNQHLTQSLDANWVRFDRADTGERVFSVDILNSRTTYQFDKHFLMRFLARYDSSAAAGLDGLAGIVRARARHRVSRRVRVAVRETRR